MKNLETITDTQRKSKLIKSAAFRVNDNRQRVQRGSNSIHTKPRSVAQLAPEKALLVTNDVGSIPDGEFSARSDRSRLC